MQVGRGQRPEVHDEQDQRRLACVVDPARRVELERWVRGQRVEHRLRLRATIIWQRLVDGQPAAAVADGLQVNVKTVHKWCGRYLTEGREGLRDRARSGAPCRFTVGQRCEVIAIACDDPVNYGHPEGSQWTLDLLTDTARARVDGAAMSPTSIHRTLTEVDLRPHKIRMWLHSRDPLFKEKVNDVVGLYLQPPEDAVVLSVDEKTSIQALERPHYQGKSAQPGRPGRQEFEYVRHGTTSLIAAFNVQSGKVVHHLGPTRTADDLLAFMEQVAEEYRDAKKVVVIWDNLNIHHEGSTRRWSAFNARHGNRFEFHFTPIHASWVNQVEVFFSLLQKGCLRWRSFRSVAALEAALARFIDRWNKVDGHPFNWTFRGYPLQSKAG